MSVTALRRAPLSVDELEVAAYTIPTDAHESDGTLGWNATTIVVVHARAGDVRGLGYTYADESAAALVRGRLAGVVEGAGALSPPAAWQAMAHAVRNIGRPGIAAMAISAVDVALWDLKARLLGLPLVTLLGHVRHAVPVYGSGGFTSYSIGRLQGQLAGWAEAGIPRVKMKVGRDPGADPDRVAAAREAIGPDVELFVDANGAYARKQALGLAARFAEQGVVWFEEPVSSWDVDGLALIRDRAPAGMAVAAGEYGSVLPDFAALLGAVDVLQADITRCGGVTGLLQVGALCAARSMPLSAHCAPSLHVHACAAIAPVVHLEYFHDHVRVERLLFDGMLEPRDGALVPDTSRAGLGLELRRADAAPFAA